MKYLVITDSQEPFYTNWFYAANHFNAEDNIDRVRSGERDLHHRR